MDKNFGQICEIKWNRTFYGKFYSYFLKASCPFRWRFQFRGWLGLASNGGNFKGKIQIFNFSKSSNVESYTQKLVYSVSLDNDLVSLLLWRIKTQTVKKFKYSITLSYSKTLQGRYNFRRSLNCCFYIPEKFSKNLV